MVVVRDVSNDTYNFIVLNDAINTYKFKHSVQ